MSVSFNGQDIQGSPFDLYVHCVSAEKSYLEVITPFPMPNQQVDLKIVAVDQNGTPLEQGGNQFLITVNDQPQVGVVFLLSASIYLK